MTVASAGTDVGVAWSRLNVIEQIVADAVASDYREAGPAGPGRRGREMTKRQRTLVAAVSLGLTGFLLAMGVSVRVINAPVVAEQRTALLERIEAAQARDAELASEVERLGAELDVARADELKRAEGGLSVARSLSQFELATGYVGVRGPGMAVVLADARPDPGEELGDLERVLDTDVQHAVNGLWAAGAEAVAVNGQRLTSRSAIRSAAGAILVNYRALRPPYRIEAIGGRSMLEEFTDGPDAATLRGVSDQFGIGFTTERLDDLTLPAASGPLPDVATTIDSEEAGA